MGKEIVLMKSEEKLPRAQVAAFLRELADKVESGTVTLKQGGEELTLEMPATVELEIKAEEEAKKTRTQRSLEVEIEWYLGEQDSGISLG
jgi:amphi-Trp domain-containing protein